MSTFRTQRLYRSRNLSPIARRSLGRLGDNPFASSGASTAIGAGASMVQTKNPTTSFAAKGASTGAAVGSVVPGIGTVIGAVAGAIIGAIGGAFIGSKRPESELWDNYKKMAGNAAGHEYDNNFRNGAFVGLVRLGKNTWPPRAAGGYGARDDARFIKDMTAKIAEAFRNGVLGPRDADANTIFSKVVGPWIAQWGTEKSGDWKRWEDQIVKDQIDAWLYDQPTVATSYTTSTWPQPRVTDLANEVLAKYATPAVPVQSPSAAIPVSTPGQVVTLPAPVTSGPGPAPGAGQAISVVAGGTTPVTVPVPTGVNDPSLAAYINALQAQGASQQDIFNRALSALSSAGVAPTADVQSAVAGQVTQAGGSGLPSWVIYLAGGAALIFALARPHRGSRR